jgi:hypothetical protein
VGALRGSGLGGGVTLERLSAGCAAACRLWGLVRRARRGQVAGWIHEPVNLFAGRTLYRDPRNSPLQPVPTS